MRQILIAMTMLLALSATARDRLYIENFSIQAGETIEVPILLENDTTYCAFQTDLYLPQGLEVEMEDDEYIIDPTSRVPSRTHVVSTSLMPDGAIRIYVSSQSVRPINGNSGAVLTMSLVATQDVSDGLVELKGSITVEESGQKHELDDYQAYVNPSASTVEATSIALDQTAAEVTVGETLQLTATVLPEDATDRTVMWTSSNTAVATVNANGLVTAVAPGTATITATTHDGTNLIATCAVTVKGSSLVGDDRLYINDFSIEAGETKLVEIQLDNTVAYTALQADIYLPEGLSIEQEGGEYLFDLTDRKARNHSIASSDLSSGAIRILIASQTLKTFSGNSGALVTFNIIADASYSGVKVIELKNVVATEPDQTEHQLPNTTCTVTGPGSGEEPPMVGDVNLDGKVDIADVNVIINMMLGKSEQTTVGDVTGDGKVDIADVNIIINIMLGKL